MKRVQIENELEVRGSEMDDDFKRTVLFIIGIYIFMNFALGKSDGGEDENGGGLAPFDLPVL